MPDLFSFSPSTFFVKKQFVFKIYKGIYKTKITMECSDVLSTSQMPWVPQMLSESLPTVFKSKCYNEQNNPFGIEVKKTEIAHLFEHIMLEYLCQYMLARGDQRVSVSGVTDWNWKKDPVGTFHITLHVGRVDSSVFSTAFGKSCDLLERLIEKNKKQMAQV